MKKILVTGAGGPSAISVIEALMRDGFELHAADMSGYAAGLYLVPPANRHLLEPAVSPTFGPTTAELCRRHRIDVLIPTVDAELLTLARLRPTIEAAGTRVLVASPLALERCLDKYRLAHLVSPIVPTPHTVLLDEWLDPAALTYPVIVKPRTGSGGRDVQKIDDAATLSRMPRDRAYMVQSYLPGTEYSVDVLCTQLGRGIAAVPRARLKVDSGIAVTSTTVHDEELEDLALRIVSLVGLNGVANLQFRRDRQGRPNLIEINARFPGTMPLTVAAGVNMPVYAVRDILGLRLPQIKDFQEIAMVRTWREHFFPLAELRALNPHDDALAPRGRAVTEDDTPAPPAAVAAAH